VQVQAAGRALLRVATLNVWGLSDWIARDGERRMRAIVGKLPELDVDLVALQEVWTLEWRRILVSGARAHGFSHHWSNREGIGGGGLLLLSRLPLASPRFQRFTLCGLPEHLHHGDYYSGKGFVIAGLTTPAGEVRILTTHLQAGYTDGPEDPHRGFRVAELVEIAAALAATRSPVVAVGDFNLQEGDPEYPLLLGLAGLRDAAAVLDHRQATTLPDHPYRGAGHGSSERIDYVLTRDGRGLAARPRSLQRVFDEWLVFDGERGAYSDHAGLRAEIEVAQADSALPPSPDERAITSAAALLQQGRAEALARRRGGRELGLAGLAGAAAAGGGAWRWRGDRRSFLRGALWAAACLGLGVGGVSGLLSERFVQNELAGYDHVDAALAKLAASRPQVLRARQVASA
jgi:endonuclease/exonuclease/phosphatase family metal-dependent hydrolase